MKKFIMITVATLLLVILAGCSHEHTWNPASCAAPKTCSTCGKMEGVPLEHQWEDATCELPATCKDCGKTAGSSIGHRWKEATCVDAKTCAICQVKEGIALGHRWENATYSKPKTCSNCGMTKGSVLPASPNNTDNDTQKCLFCDSEVWADKLYCSTHGCSYCDFYPAKQVGNTWGSACVQHSCSVPDCTRPASTNSSTCLFH